LRRRYDEEFKSSALGMIAAGRSVPDVASVLGEVLPNFRTG